MSKAISKPDETLSSVQPFEFTKEFTKQLRDLDLLGTAEHIKEEGYAVMDAGVSEDFNNRLRETCIELAQETKGAAKGYTAAILLGRDPIFEEVVLNPKIQAMVEVMCGKGALLSQLIASIRPKGAPEIGLHADQNWTPAPFPVHNQLCLLYTSPSPRDGLLSRMPSSA